MSLSRIKKVRLHVIAVILFRRGFRSDCGFARDDVELYICEGEIMRRRKWYQPIFTSLATSAVFHGIGKKKDFCGLQNPPLWFIVSRYLLSLVSGET